MKAVWNDVVIAEADKDDLIHIEGNWYYHESTPRSKEIVKKDFTDYVAFWRGVEIRSNSV